MARSAVVCVRHFHEIYRKQGVRGLVIRTKTLYILLMQSHGGFIQTPQSLGTAVSRTASGLPRIIPSVHRRYIRTGNTFYLRLWLSWFSIYRVLEFPGTLKLKTITAPGVKFSNFFMKELLDTMPLFLKQFGYKKLGSAFADLPSVRFFPLSKSTPSLATKGRRVSYSPDGILSGALALVSSDV